MKKREKYPFVSAIVAAAGTASRMGGIDKQFMELLGIPVVVRSILALQYARRVQEIIVVTRNDSIPALNALVREYGADKVKYIVAGSDSRQGSVFCGVNCASDSAQYYVIHDGARPLVSPEDVDACIQGAMEHGAAMLGVPVRDTIKRLDAQGYIGETVSRENLCLAQTPQVFEAGLYHRAMAHADEQGLDFTDDCQLVEAIGQKVFVVRGSASNLKITTPEDAVLAQAILTQREED